MFLCPLFFLQIAFEVRVLTDLELILGSGKLIRNAFDKYGKSNFSKKILKVCEDENSAFKWEEHFIKEVDAFKNPNYYNISSGGKAGFNVFVGKSEEELLLWRQRMSKSRKGRVMTEEWIAKIVKTRKERGIGVGEKNGMYGKTGSKSPAQNFHKDFQRVVSHIKVHFSAHLVHFAEQIVSPSVNYPNSGCFICF